MASMPATQQVINRLINELMRGKTALQIAIGLRAGDAVVLQLAPVFFGLTIDGNLELAQIYASRMYDTHRGTITINALIDRCEEGAKSFDHGTEEQVLAAVSWCRGAVESIQITLEAIRKRRNKALAHLDPRFVANPTYLNTEAALTIPDLTKVFEQTEKILQRIDAVHSGTIGELKYLGHDDYQVVLDLVADAKCAEAAEFEKLYGEKITWPIPAKCKKQKSAEE
ncbi:MAG: hypothetical protein WAN14_21630 [Candidatus Acidiferrales bacterium]